LHRSNDRIASNWYEQHPYLYLFYRCADTCRQHLRMEIYHCLCVTPVAWNYCFSIFVSIKTGCSLLVTKKYRKCDLTSLEKCCLPNRSISYWCKTAHILNTIPNLHYTLMSRDCAMFRRYFRTTKAFKHQLN